MGSGTAGDNEAHRARSTALRLVGDLLKYTYTEARLTVYED